MKETSLQGTTILAVDDNAVNLEALSDFLSELGCTVLLKLDGRQALALLERRVPDLILLDIVMPEMSGFELCQRLKSDPRSKEIPVIFMSALSETVDKVKGFEVGAVDYITKPFQHEELLSRVKTHLTIRQLQQDLHEKNTELQVLLERERKALERERKLTEELRLNLSLSLPHELRTPLNVILGYSQLLMSPQNSSGADDDDVAECASRIYQSGTRLHRLVENSLLYANLKLLKYTLGDRNSWLGETEIELKRFISLTAQRKAKDMQRQQDLILDLEPADIRISPANFEKILMELLDNAFKFSEAGNPVHLKTRITAKLCILSILDQGRGMTQSQIDSIGAYMQFERTHYEQQGTGLGLVIAHLLAQLEGAVISIDSQTGQGTTISLVLHCETPHPSQSALVVQSSIIGYNGAKRHILIVDAQMKRRAMLYNLLIPLGFEITETNEWQEGVARARALQPDLILLQRTLLSDSQEPSILQQFRQCSLLNNAQIVAISAEADDTEVLEPKNEKLYDGILPAPVQADELLDVLQTRLKLTWIYQENNPAQGENSVEEILPSPEALEELKTLTRIADIVAIQQWAEQLMRQDERYTPFAEKLLQMANNFDFDMIQSLLEECQEQEDS